MILLQELPDLSFSTLEIVTEEVSGSALAPLTGQTSVYNLYRIGCSKTFVSSGHQRGLFWPQQCVPGPTLN